MSGLEKGWHIWKRLCAEISFYSLLYILIADIFVQFNLHHIHMDSLYAHTSTVLFLARGVLVHTLPLRLLLRHSVWKDRWPSVHCLRYLSVSSCLSVNSLCSTGILYSLSNSTIIAHWTSQKSSARLPSHPSYSLHCQCIDTACDAKYRVFCHDYSQSECFWLLLHVPSTMDGYNDHCLHAEHYFTHHNTATEESDPRQVVQSPYPCRSGRTLTSLVADSHTTGSIDCLVSFRNHIDYCNLYHFSFHP